MIVEHAFGGMEDLFLFDANSIELFQHLFEVARGGLINLLVHRRYLCTTRWQLAPNSQKPAIGRPFCKYQRHYL
jgi:hypothetical protein